MWVVARNFREFDSSYVTARLSCAENGIFPLHHCFGLPHNPSQETVEKWEEARGSTYHHTAVNSGMLEFQL